MSDQSRGRASYYFWKWADNNLPGSPDEVHAALVRGTMHPALQSFDARPLVRRLEKSASEDRLIGAEWEWQVHPRQHESNATFVFVTCPRFVKEASRERKKAIERFFALGLSGCDAETGELIEFFLPKLNCFESGPHPEPIFDIEPSDLPALLRVIRAGVDYPFALLTDRRNHFVQCLKKGQRFIVEWRENHDIKDLKRFDQWRAGYWPDTRVPRRFVPPGLGYLRQSDDAEEYLETQEGEQELLLLADTARIFEAFVRGKPRPAAYRWENINAELP